ncbi:MAG: tryptophan synthase subunit alpha, partial [Anaerolineales bacterium]
MTSAHRRAWSNYSRDSSMTRPVDLISSAFEKPSPAFMPYFTLGYPDYETSLDIVTEIAAAGADLIELGLPFSDP